VFGLETGQESSPSLVILSFHKGHDHLQIYLFFISVFLSTYEPSLPFIAARAPYSDFVYWYEYKECGMRKFALLVVMVLLLGAIPLFGQEAGTIADVVVASASGDSPEFTTLLAAVQAADPAVLEALSDPAEQLTVFAPTDAAFAALVEALGEDAFAEVLADEAQLTDILLFHVAPGLYTSSDVVEALEAAEGNPVGIATLQGQYINITQDEDGAILVDGAPLNLEMVDIEASNGVIHVIDAVILPEAQTIADIVVASAGMEEESQFTSLLAAVQAADPTVLETLSDPEAELTVFAPTDEAFAALGEDTLNAVLADQAMLTNILLYHVAPDVVPSGQLADLLEESGGTLEVETAQGAPVTFTVDGDRVFINGAQIVVTDIDAANGVIHVINAVMLPPTAE
jgi:uncharacterized surface protein with fasciclin (FAS1) repeats